MIEILQISFNKEEVQQKIDMGMTVEDIVEQSNIVYCLK